MTRPTWRQSLDLGLTVAMAVVICLLGWRLYSHQHPQSPPPSRFEVPSAPVPLKDAFLLGDHNAPLVLLMYADFECGACRLFERDAWPAVQRDYLEKRRLVFAFQPFPLQSRGEAAIEEAALARCAGHQGKFWEAHDALYGSVGLDVASKREAVSAATGLSQPTLSACVVEERSHVRRSVAEANRLGIEGTPSFLIGSLDGSGRLRAVVAHRGVAKGSKWLTNLLEPANESSQR